MNNQLLDSIGNPMKRMNYYTVDGFINCKYLGTKSNNNFMMRFKMPNNKSLYRNYNSIPPPVPSENDDYGNTDIDDDSDNDFKGGKSKRRKSIKKGRKSIKKGRKSIKKGRKSIRRKK